MPLKCLTPEDLVDIGACLLAGKVSVLFELRVHEDTDQVCAGHTLLVVPACHGHTLLVPVTHHLRVAGKGAFDSGWGMEAETEGVGGGDGEDAGSNC